MNNIRITTNVTSKDAKRILNVLPNWLKIFGDHIEEILITYDKEPTVGRISDMHKTSDNITSIESYFNEIMRLDSRIRLIDLDYDNSNEILNKWFRGNEKPIRCQGGTPIYAFIYGIEKAESDLLLKVDCDIVFYNKGFISKAIEMLQQKNFDLVEPPGLRSNTSFGFSTRTFFINKKSFYSKLPIRAYQLDLLRKIHRKINKRPTFLSLEQMLQIEISNGNISHQIISTEFGNSMHISTLEEMNLPIIKEVIEKFGNGNIPEQQKTNSDNFVVDHWTKG